MANEVCRVCSGGVARDKEAEEFLALNQGSDFRILKCDSCGFRQLSPIPTQEYLNSIYSESYFEEGGEGGYSYADQVDEVNVAFRMRAEEFYRRLGAGAKVLDVGCATGEFLEHVKNLDMIPQGLELSSYGVSACRAKELPVEQGTLNDFTGNFGQYDGIHIGHVLEHIPDPHQAIKDLKTLIRPGGWIYIEVPLQFDGYLERLQRLRGGKPKFSVFSVHHCSFFCPSSIQKLLEMHDLKIEYLTTVDKYRRAGRKVSLRKLALNVFLMVSNWRQKGDVISIWATTNT